ncbi:MAG: DMT family transporter [Rhizobiales bacterium]|nr:DMT family transporter [Hyphomicrobiales bacterium]NRB13039.1 DMT family transporter [Hyphomicrobiales bacterium]
MTIYELAAVAAATLWAFGGMISATPSRELGAVAYVHIRMVIIGVMLTIYMLIAGTWDTIQTEHYQPLVLSGFIGIFLGDSSLFLTLNRLGPRRTAIVFSLAAPFSVILGWMFLGEHLSLLQIIGVIIVSLGVVLAVVFGKRKAQQHQWEAIKGPLWIGVSIGVFAALCQSVGSILARPVMAAGADPVAASVIRVVTSAMFLTILVRLPIKSVKRRNPLTPKLLWLTVFAGVNGMGVGMTLFLFALEGGEVGIISTLSATSPALLLPMLWIKTKEVPAIGAWVGAGMAVVGSALLFV